MGSSASQDIERVKTTIRTGEDLKELESFITKHGVNYDDGFLLKYACEYGVLSTVVIILCDPEVDVSIDDDSPIRLAVEVNDVDKVKVLLQFGADICDDLVQIAQENNNQELINLLVAA
jgi:hypothetical protein